jgi:hypothetical protein
MMKALNRSLIKHYLTQSSSEAGRRIPMMVIRWENDGSQGIASMTAFMCQAKLN